LLPAADRLELQGPKEDLAEVADELDRVGTLIGHRCLPRKWKRYRRRGDPSIRRHSGTIRGSQNDPYRNLTSADGTGPNHTFRRCRRATMAAVARSRAEAFPSAAGRRD